MTRAVRVLNEIETRIHELREELEHQAGSQSGGSNNGGSQSRSSGKSSKSSGDDEENGDEEYGHTKGAVRHPESDRRLKANRDD